MVHLVVAAVSLLFAALSAWSWVRLRRADAPTIAVSLRAINVLLFSGFAVHQAWTWYATVRYSG